jgi:molybdopterin molybdotransferase
MASLGVHRADVKRRPRVGVIATGRELADFTTPVLKHGQIRNSTSPYLQVALARLGCDVIMLGTCQDDIIDFRQKIRTAMDSQFDIILTTGAVSMGNHDFVRDVLESLGAEVQFHKVAIRPGKPLLFAEFKEGPVVFGVPGNPVSTVVGLRFFIEPYLRAISGQAPEAPAKATLLNDFQKPKGLRCFFKARVFNSAGSLGVEILNGQLSAWVGPLVEANAWAVLPEDGEYATAGARVDIYPILPVEKPWGLSGHDGSIESVAHDLSPSPSAGCC